MLTLIHRILRRPIRTQAVRRTVPRSNNETALDRLLVGRSKHDVHQRLGPPRNASHTGSLPPAGADPLFWQASAWYYPFDTTARTAMAVFFDGPTVRKIELLHTTPPAEGLQ